MVIVIMGVSGSGKTTVGQRLAEQLGGRYEEGDSYHPPANVEKMRRGVPLTDDDRWPWLRRLSDLIGDWLAEPAPVVLACSALKRAYRDLLTDGRSEVRIVYLRGSAAAIQGRLTSRTGHFMPARLLNTQFEALEEPAPDENVLTIDIDAPPGDLAGRIAAKLAADRP